MQRWQCPIRNGHQYPWNLYLINSLEDVVAFLGIKVSNSENSYMFSCSRNADVTFVEKPQFKMSVFKIKRTSISNSYFIRHLALKVTVVSRTLPSLHIGSLAIILTIFKTQKLKTQNSLLKDGSGSSIFHVHIYIDLTSFQFFSQTVNYS